MNTFGGSIQLCRRQSIHRTDWCIGWTSRLGNDARKFYFLGVYQPGKPTWRQFPAIGPCPQNLGHARAWIAGRVAGKLPPHLAQFIRETRHHCVTQHEARSHMKSDLMRYAFAAAFAQIHDGSSKGAKEFPEELHPEHKSWGAPNRFVDRPLQTRTPRASNTLTGHLAGFF